uniref:Uncharacterized protein n=1 Tax=Leersia perrieri TaxID=77586 RepID=A0A0D9W2C1_9ORYZ
MSDVDEGYSASESDNSHGIYTIDDNSNAASASGTLAQHLTTIQAILSETPYDAATNPDIANRAKRIRAVATNLDSAFEDTSTDPPPEPTNDEAARRVATATAEATAQATRTVAANNTNGNANAEGQAPEKNLEADPERCHPRNNTRAG